MTADERFMREALKQAKKAAALGEVPVGCVVVCDGEIVARGYNRREVDKNALAHAELKAIDRACKKLGGWRLWKCDLYVTLEPCPMCAGALLASRVSRGVYGAKDPAAGAMGTVVNLPRYPLGAHPEVAVGVLEDECRTVLQDFFKNCRK